ncbi:MAG: hypothetical protein WCK67_13305 [bacterium]
MINGINNSINSLSFTSKKEVPKTNNKIQNNTLIMAGTTTAGAGIAGGVTLVDCLKHAKMKFAIFANNCFKKIGENSKQEDLIYGYTKARIENEKKSMPRYYIEEIKSDAKSIASGYYKPDDRVLLNMQKEQDIFKAYLSDIKTEFHKKFKVETIKKVATKASIGAMAGLAVGLSIIGISHLINNNRDKPKD